MLAAADLTYEAVSARMETILRAGIPIPKCWVICIPAHCPSGAPWAFVLEQLWGIAKAETSAVTTPLSLRYEDIAVVGSDRVLVLIGVR